MSVLPLTSARFGGQLLWASGLDYFSTLSIGMYTQPLGFVLLLIWYAVYFEAHRRPSRFMISSVLLALAVLANYLNVSTRSLDANARSQWFQSSARTSPSIQLPTFATFADCHCPRQ